MRPAIRQPLRFHHMFLKPTIYSLSLTTQNTEYSQALPEGTRKVLIRERSGGADLKLAFASGQSGTVYVTIPAGSAKALDMAYLSGLTLYLQSPTNAVVAEIEAWTDK